MFIPFIESIYNDGPLWRRDGDPRVVWEVEGSLPLIARWARFALEIVRDHPELHAEFVAKGDRMIEDWASINRLGQEMGIPTTGNIMLGPLANDCAVSRELFTQIYREGGGDMPGLLSRLFGR